MPAQRGCHVADLTWPEVAERAAAGAVALLPVGAACKAHGLHLPMATDWLQAEWLARRAVERRALLAWPTLGYGHYPAFTDYPGSVDVAATTFAALVADILAAVIATGVRGCVVLNTGISTIAPLRDAVGGRSPRVRLHNVCEGARYRHARSRLAEQKRGGHADEMETSVMLAIAPERVYLAAALPADGVDFGPGPLRREAGPNHSPTGAYGDPTLATTDKGRVLVDAMVDDLLASIDAAADAGQT